MFRAAGTMLHRDRGGGSTWKQRKGEPKPGARKTYPKYAYNFVHNVRFSMKHIQNHFALLINIQ
jgi:hypothetical protein